ncbi:YlaH-like family protein [Sediminibacillus halophilus]|uniref:YlaH-like protein n=1 Tax=Sediminibacillus halophilus TaxID=482461 RepID=A0A1G9MWF5_9BACI|nr:YlaH-like family protein [Sediminibacillus halophilus]SDL78247.1 YlaH-like protein [Sediminibacillus halophilus]
MEETNEAIDIGNNLPIVDFLFNTAANGDLLVGFLLLYLTIGILLAICYKLGFARKLPLLKSLIVYIFLFIGAFIIAMLGLKLPMAECLVIIALVLGIYRFRLAQDRKRRNNQMENN